MIEIAIRFDPHTGQLALHAPNVAPERVYVLLDAAKLVAQQQAFAHIRDEARRAILVPGAADLNLLGRRTG